ncbi:hypothetical protein BJ508DRAFT_171757 [Ascobolus immersus RN42]|uniref:C2H2-domain containing protein second zinc finger domain-containing protein n=1 Tax=Ascobolus immersus RN42 TaxID=1160509 RepID=A0A3N4HVS5_ASCIM|nr:hypothetical protein BJ508DRAFT_171757 [Ascobolus immersus RN42]
MLRTYGRETHHSGCPLEGQHSGPRRQTQTCEPSDHRQVGSHGLDHPDFTSSPERCICDTLNGWSFSAMSISESDASLSTLMSFDDGFDVGFDEDNSKGLGSTTLGLRGEGEGGVEVSFSNSGLELEYAPNVFYSAGPVDLDVPSVGMWSDMLWMHEPQSIQFPEFSRTSLGDAWVQHRAPSANWHHVYLFYGDDHNWFSKIQENDKQEYITVQCTDERKSTVPVISPAMTTLSESVGLENPCNGLCLLPESSYCRVSGCSYGGSEVSDSERLLHATMHLTPVKVVRATPASSLPACDELKGPMEVAEEPSVKKEEAAAGANPCLPEPKPMELLDKSSTNVCGKRTAIISTDNHSSTNLRLKTITARRSWVNSSSESLIANSPTYSPMKASHPPSTRQAVCHYNLCSRSRPENGFRRQDNLRAHLRMVHGENIARLRKGRRIRKFT